METVEGVIVAWHPNGTGFIKLHDRKLSLYLREENIVTLGVETLRPGSRVRCQIGESDAGHKFPQAIEVEIYLNGERN